MNTSALLLLMVISTIQANELQIYKNAYHRLVDPWARPVFEITIQDQNQQPVFEIILAAEKVKVQMASAFAKLLKVGVTAHGVSSGPLTTDKLVVMKSEEIYPVLNPESTTHFNSLTFEEILLKAKEIMADGENKIKQILRQKPAEDIATIDKAWLNKDTDFALDSMSEFNRQVLGGINYIIILLLNEEAEPKQYPILKLRYFEYVSAYVDSYINRIILSHQQFTEEDNKFEAERKLAQEQRERDEEVEKARKEAEAIIERERIAVENARKEEARLEKVKLEQERLEREAAAKKKKAASTGTSKKTTTKKPSGTNSTVTKKPSTKSPTSTKNRITQKPTTKKTIAADKQSTLTDSTNPKVNEINQAYIDAKNAIVARHQDRLNVIMDDLYYAKSALNSKAIDSSLLTPIDEEGKEIVAELIKMIKNLNTENIFNIRSELEILRREVDILEGVDVTDNNEVKINNQNILI